MAYLIDGNNFLGCTETGDFRNPEIKLGLILKLLVFQRVTKARVVLVFDGPPDPEAESELLKRKKFTVVHPRPGRNADETIGEIIDRQSDLRRFFVVSSDREVGNVARRKGARVLSCKAFHRELKKVLRDNRKSREMGKKTSSPSVLEVELWQEMFRDKT